MLGMKWAGWCLVREIAANIASGEANTADYLLLRLALGLFVELEIVALADRIEKTIKLDELAIFASTTASLRLAALVWLLSRSVFAQHEHRHDCRLLKPPSLRGPMPLSSLSLKTSMHCQGGNASMIHRPRSVWRSCRALRSSGNC